MPTHDPYWLDGPSSVHLDAPSFGENAVEFAIDVNDKTHISCNHFII